MVGIAAVAVVVRCTRGRSDDIVVEDTVSSPGVVCGRGGGREKGFGLYCGVVVQRVEFCPSNTTVAGDAVLGRKSLARHEVEIALAELEGALCISE